MNYVMCFGLCVVELVFWTLFVDIYEELCSVDVFIFDVIL